LIDEFRLKWFIWWLLSLICLYQNENAHPYYNSWYCPQQILQYKCTPLPPHLSVSKIVQYMKGGTSRKLQMEYKELNKQFWGQHLWARGYFAASNGNVTDEVIAEYIRNQDLEENMKSDNFGISQL
jgi:hypothetical protein